MPLSEIINNFDLDIEQPSYSQATCPPSSQASEVFEISDSDESPTTVPASSSPNLQTLELSSDEDSFTISSPRKLSSCDKGKARATDIDAESGSDSDFPDAHDLLKGLRSRTLSSTSSSYSSYPVKRHYSASNCDDDCAHEIPSPPKKTRVDATKQIKRELSDAAERKKISKDHEREKRKAEKLKEKERKEAEKAAKKAQREAEKAQKQQEKTDKAAHKNANKLVMDKTVAIKEMTLVLSESFESSLGFVNLLHAKLDEYGTTIKFGPSLLPGYDTVRWQRRIYREYSTSTREWLPVDPPYQKYEKLALVRLVISQLRSLVNKNELGDLVAQLRRTHNLEPADQVFIMIFGMGKLRKRKFQEWNRFEDALTSLQFNEHTYHAYVEDDQEGVDRLFNYSGDLGIKEEKLISRSHLPFCSNVKVTKGQDLPDTWTKMLDQIHRLTKSSASGIVAEYPTLRNLKVMYDENPQIAEQLLIDCKVEHRRDGRKTSAKLGHGKLGQALSRRVHTVLCGTDHLELVVKDSLR